MEAVNDFVAGGDTDPLRGQNQPISQGIQIGVDIGQRVDPTAIVVVEHQLRDYRINHPQNHDELFTGGRPVGGEIYYVARHIERLRLGTSYPKVAERLVEIYGKLDRKKIIACCVDATGVGLPVVEEIEKQGINVTPVYITAGRAVTEVRGEIHLAKEQMVSRLQVLIDYHRILLPPDDAEAQAMAEELKNFQIKVTDSANLQFEAKVGTHDDMVVALALATWEGADRRIYIVYDDPIAAWLNDWRG
jgi:hypothetical protein